MRPFRSNVRPCVVPLPQIQDAIAPNGVYEMLLAMLAPSSVIPLACPFVYTIASTLPEGYVNLATLPATSYVFCTLSETVPSVCVLLSIRPKPSNVQTVEPPEYVVEV